ncbi:hypothetical protein DRQ53_09995 [bacterium]|nr:MAG: hypothetical protein DRQ32_01205 [bacterium]RKZ15075.1 MAG: hypothetical protein DRQ53_09995 [bacterium]
MDTRWIKYLFVVGGLYDAILGVAFLLVPANLFTWFDVTPPNHWGYVRFPALLLILFGVMFLSIAADPVRRRELMLYGCGLKVAYCGTVFWYAVTAGIPGMWMPWAWADLAFLVLFALAWHRTGSKTA